MKKNTVRVYDTMSKKVVEVEVSDEVRTHYNRTQWNIDDNDESFFKHEIQFSALIGGHENAFENFREFILDYDIEKETDRKIFTERLYNCLKLLSESERDLITMLFWLHPEDAIKQRERLKAERIAAREQRIESVREEPTMYPCGRRADRKRT